MVAKVILHREVMEVMLHNASFAVGFRYGKRTEQLAKRYVRKRSHHLEESITTRQFVRGGIPVTQVGSDLPYAADVHEGTGVFGPHKQRITPKHGKYLVFQAPDGTLVFARSVRGTRPNRYLTRALRDAMLTRRFTY